MSPFLQKPSSRAPQVHLAPQVPRETKVRAVSWGSQKPEWYVLCPPAWWPKNVEEAGQAGALLDLPSIAPEQLSSLLRGVGAGERRVVRDSASSVHLTV